jgi:hypothetical protein
MEDNYNMVQIEYPQQTTYFIAYINQRLAAWGVINPNEVMSSGMEYLYQTTDINQWNEELKNYYVVWGYQFPDLFMAEFFKRQIEEQYPNQTIQIEFAQYNQPQFWYIVGYFPLIFGEEKQSFQVFPN